MELPVGTADDEDDEIFGMLAVADDELTLSLTLSFCRSRQRLRPRRGSVYGRVKSMARHTQLGHHSIMRDYLGPNPVYDDTIFQQRYGLPSELFCRVLREVTRSNAYFQQKPDAVGKMGASPEHKMTAALRMLVGGSPADAQNECCRISESTVMDSFHGGPLWVRFIYDHQPLMMMLKSLALTRVEGCPFFLE
ncbi:hypothetical protein PPTG_20302, partial [Phytophthora nicotianae INRA-310]